MSQPWRPHPHGVWYYRARLPAQHMAAMSGRTVTLSVAGEETLIKLGLHIKVSLRTTDESEARRRHADVGRQLEERWASSGRQAAHLDQRQVEEIAGDWYHD